MCWCGGLIKVLYFFNQVDHNFTFILKTFGNSLTEKRKIIRLKINLRKRTKLFIKKNNCDIITVE